MRLVSDDVIRIDLEVWGPIVRVHTTDRRAEWGARKRPGGVHQPGLDGGNGPVVSRADLDGGGQCVAGAGGTEHLFTSECDPHGLARHAGEGDAEAAHSHALFATKCASDLGGYDLDLDQGDVQ